MRLEKVLKISARKSDLARLQAYMVGEALQKKNPDLKIEFKFKESLGDINLTDPLWKIPEKGVFTEDFYAELQKGETDFVVHSWKDLPTEIKPDTMIAATLPRADQRDLLLVKKSHFEKIKAAGKMTVFSSSPRREYNLTDFFKTHLPFNLSDVRFESVRGNIPTRIRKLLESDTTDGLIVAKAALDRLLVAPQAEFAEVQTLLRSYLDQVNWVVLPLTVNPNAAAQGALAIEIRSDRQDLKDLLAGIHDAATFDCVQQERQILSNYGGGCHQKIGIAVLARPYGTITMLQGLTNAGETLNRRDLKLDQKPPQFAASAMWSAEAKADRIANANVKIPASVNALFVARTEAWPEGHTTSDFVWTAGLKTWKNLAQKGIWVHGSTEGFGEQEDARIEVLAGSNLQWAKLSHEAGYAEDESVLPLVATYALKPQGPSPVDANAECFFWSSGSQFLQAANELPAIATKHHACGPGNTHKVIRQYLENNKAFDPNRLHVFLDQEDWRQQCTK